ncbi:MAG: hypothetical protein CME05_10390 [Gemmatimonadaceae bacterium]|nr:hypothetical protein [Gemmatimonadaceae bacterium]
MASGFGVGLLHRRGSDFGSPTSAPDVAGKIRMSRRHPPHHHPCPLRGVLTPALLCGVILLGEPVLAQTVGDPVASRSAKAREHYDEGRYEEALRAYRDALVERPGSEPLHLNVGDALYELGDYEAAAGEFEQVTLAEDEGLAAEGYFNLGNSRYQLQDYPAAVEAYREALRRTPGDVDAKANLELALQMLQSPTPQQQPSDGEQQQGQDQDQSEQSDEQGKDQQQQQPAESDSEQPQEPPSTPQPQQDPGEESEPQDSQSSEEQTEGEQTEEDPVPLDSEDDQRMDEEEAEQLLDALGDREEEGQKRRFRMMRRGSEERDW